MCQALNLLAKIFILWFKRIMKIQNNRNNINFGVKLDTAKVLEVTSMKIFRSDGIEGCKEVVHALNDKPIKAAGNRGYKYYAEIIGKQITEKYPQKAEATAKISEITSQNPNIKKAELNKQVEPLIAKIGNVIDIEI